MDLSMYLFIGIIFGFVFGFACYKIIEDKGYDNANTWAICGFFFGIIALILALAKPNIRQQSEMLDAMRGVNQKAASPADEILKYKELLDQGIITQEEFDKKKKELLQL